MILELKEKTIIFEEVPISFNKKDIHSVFGKKNNKTLYETLKHPKYKHLNNSLTISEMNSPLGQILLNLKNTGDNRYLKFLNKYGDEIFCEFSIKENLSDYGLYCWVENDVIKYVGRCIDNFNKRINQGYGKISPKNCFIDGQVTNCHLNSQINKAHDIKFFIFKMTGKTKEEVKILEKEILNEKHFDWNIKKG